MFFTIPIGVDYRTRRYPMVTFAIMGICALLYVVTLVCEFSGNRESVDQWIADYLWLTPSHLHWWAFITCQFVHEGFWHLFGNMIYLFLFGSCVEDTIGRLHFTGFYLLCGILATLTHIVLSYNHPAYDLPLGGASGAISGCIGGFLLLLAKTRIEFKWVIFLFFRVWHGEYRVPAWIVISFWFAEDFIDMLSNTFGPGQGGGGVAFAAHVGGTLAGVGLIWLEKIRLKRHGPIVIPDDDDDEEVTEVRPVFRAAPAAAAEPAVRKKYTLKGAVPVEPEPTVIAMSQPAVEIGTIHLSRAGTQSGPFTAEQIQQKFIADEIPADVLYWQEGMEDWRSAEELRAPGG